MYVKMIGTPPWTWRGMEWPPEGGVVEVPEAIGRDLIQTGFADYATKPAEPVPTWTPPPVAMTTEPAERAVKPKARTRTKKV